MVSRLSNRLVLPLQGNRGELGGAIYSTRGAVRLVDCRFVDNLAEWGGAVYTRGAVYNGPQTAIRDT
jgi:hypothetical protein